MCVAVGGAWFWFWEYVFSLSPLCEGLFVAQKHLHFHAFIPASVPKIKARTDKK